MVRNRPGRPRPTVLLGVVALTLGAAPLVQLSRPAPFGRALAATGPALRATFLDTDDWGTGYVGEYEVTNVGPAIAPGWQLTFSLPAGSQLLNSWGGVASVAGEKVSVNNASWDGVLARGATADFGFQVAHTGAFGAPSSCTLDGSPCQGGPPTGTVVPTTTATTVRPTTTSVTSPPVPGRRGPSEFAPYIDMTLQPQDLAAISSASGARVFTLAFVVSEGDCTPAWGGVTPVGSPADYVKEAIDAFRQAGGSVIVSFGGEAGTELAGSAPSVAALEAAYQKVVDTYGVYDLDFDIEGAAVGDLSSVGMRSAALAQLQRDEASLGHQVEVSLTLPALPSGLPSQELAVVRSAVAAGVRLSLVNPMTMDYGGAVSGPAGWALMPSAPPRRSKNN